MIHWFIVGSGWLERTFTPASACDRRHPRYLIRGKGMNTTGEVNYTALHERSLTEHDQLSTLTDIYDFRAYSVYIGLPDD